MIKTNYDYFCVAGNVFKHSLVENSKLQVAKHKRVRPKQLYIMETQYSYDTTRYFPVKEGAEKVQSFLKIGRAHV